MFGQQKPAVVSSSSPRVAIVGSGFSGLCLGIRLKAAGIETFTIFEKADAIGGTWRDNHYPGAACDVQSHLYSFSFEPNPSWSRMFAGHAEIRRYLDHCADKYGLRGHVRHRSEVESARFDAARGTWTLTLRGGETFEADVLCSATGALSRPSLPDIPGLSSFAGKVFHSSSWDHAYALEGKTVGVIGTGASAVQFVPHVAARASKLHLFQRTPPWILPKPDRAISGFMQGLYARAPFTQTLHRGLIYSLLELRVLGFVVDPALMRLPQLAALRYLKKVVKDPELRAKLTPSYPIGCKRILPSNDYLQALVRPNVEVVDTGIARIEPDGVVTKDGAHRKLDALILGTGFTASESIAPFPIFGTDGVELNEHWKNGAEAYYGTTVAGYPSFFMFFGPNSALGHSSMVYMIEAQVEHFMRALAALREKNARSLDVRPDVFRRFNDALQEKLAKTVWASDCTSWYKTKDGRNTTLWPGFTFAFRKGAVAFDADDYVFAPAHAGVATIASTAAETSP